MGEKLILPNQITDVDVEDGNDEEQRVQTSASKTLPSSPVISAGTRPKIWSLVDTATEVESSPCPSPVSSPRNVQLTPDQLFAASKLYNQQAQALHKQWCQALAHSASLQQQQQQLQIRERTPSPEGASSSSSSSSTAAPTAAASPPPPAL